MSDPLVSVVMPAFNAEAFVAEAVESILGQTFRDFEFVIIDDGSTDGTGSILAQYAASDPRIVLVSNDRNIGIIGSLNRGLELARGRYVARQDADDVSLPHRLEKQVAFMNSHAEVGICGSWVKEIGAAAGFRKYYSDDASVRSALLFGCPLAHPSVMLRKDVLTEYGLKYDEAYPHSEDYALWAQAAPHTRFANIPQVLVLYRMHPGSVTSRERETQHAATTRVRHGLIEKMGGAFTEEEVLLHEEIGSRVFSCSRDFVRRAEAWLRKLHETNQRLHACPEPAFSRILADEWHYVCDRQSYYGIGEATWALMTYRRSPLAAHGDKTLTGALKRARWLMHGPVARRVRGLFSRPTRSTGTGAGEAQT